MNHNLCPAAAAADCPAAHCSWKCAPEVIDELLAQGDAVSGEEVDLLLELRSLLRQRNDGEGALRLFCQLRRRMEARHYLAFFRMRRWLENHVAAVVSPCPLAEPHVAPVRLDHYCIEAVRRACLCAAMAHGVVLLAPRVAFNFRSDGHAVAEAPLAAAPAVATPRS